MKKLKKIRYDLSYKYRYKVEDKIILFESGQGESFASNLRNTYEMLIKDKRYQDYTFVWAFANPAEYRDLEEDFHTIIVKSGSKKYYRYCASAKYIILNTSLRPRITLKKEQIFIPFACRAEMRDDEEGYIQRTLENDLNNSISSRTFTLQAFLEHLGFFVFPEITARGSAEDLSKQQCVAIEALRELKKICDKHEIFFYLLAGTTLGAVRHKGMIPWDDDIDVGFLYDDWYKIRDILPRELKNSKFKYVDEKLDESFPRLFGKILYDNRNCVDIFLIAKWTSKPFAGKFHWKIRHVSSALHRRSIHYKRKISPYASTKYRIKYYMKHIAIEILYCILRIVCKRKDYIKLARWNEKYYEGKETDCYINLYSCYSLGKEIIEAEWIEKPSEVEFEGNIYQTVGNTDAYLRHLYGDYMKLPPVQKRRGRHSERFMV